MVKGASVKFKSYQETIPKFLELLNLQSELKKHDNIVIKVNLNTSEYPQFPESETISPGFLESVLNFININKNPGSEIFIAEGANGVETNELFENTGITNLAEKYSITLLDLNNAEVIEIEDPSFIKYESIFYPKILKDSLLISLTFLSDDPDIELSGSLSNMLGAFPLKYYKGLFSKNKSKLKKWPLEYSIHDILICKMPDFSILDASKQGIILAGQPFEIDKQAAKLVGRDWRTIPYMKLLNKTFPPEESEKPEFKTHQQIRASKPQEL